MKIFLAILLITALLLIIPVRVEFFSSPEMTVRLKYIFFKKQLFPVLKKEKKQSGKKVKKKKQDKKRKGFPLSLKEMLPLLSKAYSRLLPPIKKLLRRTTIAKFRLKIAVAGDDVAETAIKFGKTNAVVTNIVALADKIFTLRVREIDIIPSFESFESSFDCHGEVRLTPLAAIAAAVSLAVNLLILLLPCLMRKKEKGCAPVDRKDDSDGKEKSAG